MSYTEHFGSFSIVRNGITITLDLIRFERQYHEAQLWLDRQVMRDMEPFMPKQTGTFINLTKAISESMAGTGLVCAGAAPMGRFLYEGKTMVDEKTGSPWARKDAKKVLVSDFAGITNAKPILSYNKHANPDAQAYWFEASKKANEKDWIKNVKKIGGGGING